MREAKQASVSSFGCFGGFLDIFIGKKRIITAGMHWVASRYP
jgi:hypothetical protein